MEHPDVLIIGTGTAGQSCAYDLVKAGYHVMIVEHSSRPGGVCALSGCQPQKWFYEAAHTVARSQHLLLPLALAAVLTINAYSLQTNSSPPRPAIQ